MFHRIVQMSALLALAAPAMAQNEQPPTGTCQIKFEGAVTDSIVKKIIDDINRVCSREWKLRIVISSSGGHGLSAIYLYDFLVRWPHEVQTHGKVIQSATAIIFLAGDVRTMSKDGVFMIHPFTAELEARRYTEAELFAKAYGIQKLNLDTVAFVSRMTGLPKEKVQELYDAGTDLTPEQAKKMGFVDEVVP